MGIIKYIFSPGSTSDQWRVNVRDFLKGLVTAVLTAPVTIIMQSLDAGDFVFDWKTILKVAIAGGLGYLVKNFLTPSPKQ